MLTRLRANEAVKSRRWLCLTRGELEIDHQSTVLIDWRCCGAELGEMSNSNECGSTVEARERAG
jgi:hypothetical protein